MKKILLTCALLLSFTTITAFADDLKNAREAFEHDEFGRAFELYLSLAAADIAEAEDMLGLMYTLGVGVERDVAKAVVWLSLADSHGVDGASDMRAMLIKDWKTEIIARLVKE